MLAIALEATTAADATAPTFSASHTYWGGLEQNGSDAGTINTIRVGYQQQTTKQASGDWTVTYPNAQASNGAGVQLYIQPSVDSDTVQILTATEGLVEGYLAYTENGIDIIDVDLLAVMPFGRKVSELMKDGKTFVMAHRGGSLDYPEMTMRAYTQAVSLGCTGLEFSVARSSDGVFFGLHDATLNRTSPSLGPDAAGGGADVLPSQRTWAQIQALNVVVGDAAGFGPQPYMKLSDLVAAYGPSHTIFIDPKVVGNANIPDLIAYLKTIPDYANTFVGKYFHTGFVEVGRVFRAAGMKTWGYYYPDDLAAAGLPSGSTKKAVSIAETAVEWDYLGLSWDATDAAWAEVKAYGKPVIGHITPNLAAAQEAFRKGASGVMASGIRSVMSGYVS